MAAVRRVTLNHRRVRGFEGMMLECREAMKLGGCYELSALSYKLSPASQHPSFQASRHIYQLPSGNTSFGLFVLPVAFGKSGAI